MGIPWQFCPACRRHFRGFDQFCIDHRGTRQEPKPEPAPCPDDWT